MIVNPGEIEKKSFAIIQSELPASLDVKEEHKKTIFRVIHTTADFEYAEIIKISDKAVEKGLEALKKGCKIYTDTRMIIAGVNKRVLKKLGCEIVTYIDDEEVRKTAQERGVTRSIAAMEKALADKSIKIFVIGNAPTALFTLSDAINAGKSQPDLVIGVPVGFVGAAESKEEIKKCKVPSIITVGRKGGSTVAAAMVNSLLYQVSDER